MLLPDSEFGGSQAASTFAAVDTLDSLHGPSGKWWSWTGLVVLSPSFLISTGAVPAGKGFGKGD